MKIGIELKNQDRVKVTSGEVKIDEEVKIEEEVKTGEEVKTDEEVKT